MSFLSKLFGSKDSRHYIDKGDRLFSSGNISEARQEYLEALELLEKKGDTEGILETVKEKVKETGNLLGSLNLQEAEHAARRGDREKAREHLELLLHLAENPELTASAKTMLASLDKPAPTVAESRESNHSHSSGCSGCAPAVQPLHEDGETGGAHLSLQERFELMIHTLPGDLPRRYADLGPDFMSAYVMLHNGQEMEGARILQNLLREQDNDVLLYELAVLCFRGGDAARCETFLKKALSLNGSNPLCHLSLVQLLADAGRFDEAVPLLEHMVKEDILPDQATIFLGDIKQRKGDHDGAIAEFSKALGYPGIAKSAAERLVPLLTDAGKNNEAAFLVKKYLKGCC